MQTELHRLQSAVNALALSALQDERPLEARADAARQLADAIAEFVGGLRTEHMPRDVSDALTRALRVMRYLDEVARLAPSARYVATAAASQPALLAVVNQTVAALRAANAGDAPDATFEAAYQHAKASVLNAAVVRHMDVAEADALLDELSGLRRLVQQWAKAVALPSERPAERVSAGSHAKVR